jgi:hypothetical protein
MPQERDDNSEELPMVDVAWDIRREGRSRTGDEAMARFALTPEKFEMYQGRLFWNEAER